MKLIALIIITYFILETFIEEPTIESNECKRILEEQRLSFEQIEKDYRMMLEIFELFKEFNIDCTVNLALKIMTLMIEHGENIETLREVLSTLFMN